jgi:uncharacterized membrane protein
VGVTTATAGAPASAPDRVRLKDLEGVFWESLGKVKDALYDYAVKQQRLFPSNPESVRTFTTVGLIFGLVALGLIIGGLAGVLLGAALVGLPFLVAALPSIFLAKTLARRTGLGREMHRRALGFRLFLTTAQTEYQQFLEEKGVFDRYLPYAMVFHCVQKWAAAFENLGDMPVSPSWYASNRPFTPLLFANSLNSFAGNVSTTMASVPTGSSSSGWAGGFSGFSGGGGGGFSGGGGGGGGGGSW